MPEGPEGPYNPQAAARELATSQTNRRVRKLSFFDQCAAFYALYNGVETRYVAKAFGISLTAASQIGGCLDKDPRPYTTELAIENGEVIERVARHRDMNRHRNPDRIPRYRRIADEFERLGEIDFANKYFPFFIRDRIKDAKRAYDETNPPRMRRGFDPSAIEGAGPLEMDGEMYDVVILDDPPGWYVVARSNGKSFGRDYWEGGERKGFAKARHARQTMITGELK